MEDLSILSIKNDIIKPNIEQLKDLKKICVHAYFVNDDIAVFKNLTQLNALDLRYNHDLDDGIFKYLTNLSNLECLNLIGTKVTSDSVDENKKYFSKNCEIHINQN